MIWIADRDVRKGDEVEITDEVLIKSAYRKMAQNMNKNITSEERSRRAYKMWEHRSRTKQIKNT